MNILGVGPAELLVILIIALLVFGPTRLPQVARDLGKAIGKWRKALDEIQSVTDAPLKEMKEIKEAVDPAAMERKLQESVQRIVTAEPPSPQPKEHDQEPAQETIQEQQEEPEAKD